MSVLIRGMKMPSCCDDCWALDEYGDYPVCRITEEQRGYYFRIREERMDRCPLISVPPHGRLIDVDALECMEFETCHTDDWYQIRERIRGENFIRRIVNNAPTIIEAEG